MWKRNPPLPRHWTLTSQSEPVQPCRLRVKALLSGEHADRATRRAAARPQTTALPWWWRSAQLFPDRESWLNWINKMTVTFLRYKNKIVRCKCNGRKPCCAFSSHQTGIPPLPASPAPMWRSSERSRARGFFFFVALCLSCSTQGVLGFAYPAIHLQRSALRQKSHSSVLQLRSQISPFAAPEHITSAASFHATSTLFAGEGGHKDARVIQTRTTRLVGLNLL